ncbi:hypothetical protein SUGI_0959740 [Cryptomeria japonica]|nr:hypothetical protein SUGI_0959740 [Cryptomeria japonica]
MMEDGPSSQKGLNAGMDEGNHCWDSKGLVGMEIQNLKSLEDAKSYGWIELENPARRICTESQGEKKYFGLQKILKESRIWIIMN